MIKLIDVNKHYTDQNNNSFSLSNISLEIQDKDIFGFVGKSGAGKSTLLNLIGTLDNVNDGKIIISGTEVTNLNEKNLRFIRKNIGYIFQEANLLKNLTIIENVALPLKLSKLKKQERLTKAKKMLEYVGLLGFEDRYPHQLSGGQNQRVSIARALINNPKILLCDEITSALDMETSYEIIELLKHINTDLGLTIVYVSHDLNLVKLICNKVAIVKSGLIEDVVTLDNLDSKMFNKVFDYKSILRGDLL